jgi:hypothetical protein
VSTLTRTEIEAFLERHRESFASRDPARVAADHAPDGTFESPAAGLARGREAIESVYRYWVRAYPDIEFVWREPIIDGNRVALFWHFRGTLSGDYFGQVKAGTRVEFPGAAEYVMSPDGIVTAKHLFDFTGSLVAAGVLKIKPDKP